MSHHVMSLESATDVGADRNADIGVRNGAAHGDAISAAHDAAHGDAESAVAGAAHGAGHGDIERAAAGAAHGAGHGDIESAAAGAAHGAGHGDIERAATGAANGDVESDAVGVRAAAGAAHGDAVDAGHGCAEASAAGGDAGADPEAVGDGVEQRLASGGVDLSADARREILTAIRNEAPAVPPAHHLAQMNIARFRRPMDHPEMTAFVEMLDPINHQAEAAPGFVWRLTDEGSNDATSIAFYDDPLLLLNMSVWEDVSSLRNYVYRGEHHGMVKRRHEWADVMDSAYLVLWWVPAGHVPTIEEGDARLRLLREHGPTANAFTFGRSFPPPS